jgi:hypothetical protein
VDVVGRGLAANCIDDQYKELRGTSRGEAEPSVVVL